MLSRRHGLKLQGKRLYNSETDADPLRLFDLIHCQIDFLPCVTVRVCTRDYKDNGE